MDVTQLNDRFSQSGRLEFRTDAHGQVQACLSHGGNTATLYLQGAHLTSCCLAGNEDLLWLSGCSAYQPGKAIRGGVPICWPWFGPHDSREDRPQHGFARTSVFEVDGADVSASETSLQLALRHPQPAFAEWLSTEGNSSPDITVRVTLSETIELEIVTMNASAAPCRISSAIHTYLRVGNSAEVQVPELIQLSYLDKLRQYRKARQTIPPVFDEEIDRIYLSPPGTVNLYDPVLGRRIKSTSWGNKNLVVWNPGAANAATMADFDNEGYQRMLCLEPANALDDSVWLMPGESHVMGQRLSVSAL